MLRRIRSSVFVAALLAGPLHLCAQPELFLQDRGSVANAWFLDREHVQQLLPINTGSPLAGWDLAAVADLNLDGNPDLIWYSGSGQASVWYMADRAGTVFGHSEPLGPPAQLAGLKVVGFADLNHDGHPDLLLQRTEAGSNPAKRELVVWYLAGSDGRTLLASARIGALAGWSAVGIADLNSDGNADVVWQNDATREIAVWYLNPAGLPQSYGALDRAGDPGWSIAGAKDMDGDGHADLVWRDASGAHVSVWYLSGQMFSREATFSVPGGAGLRVVVPWDGGTGPIVTFASVPTRWNGINYSPRYHSYFRMLKEWDQFDPRLGEYVYQAADRDMDALSKSGYNLLHLYLWDKRLLDEAVFDRWCPVDPESGRRPLGCTPPYSEPAGFPNFPDSPSATPEGLAQLAALQDFVARAEMHGLYVALHFASGRLLDELSRLIDQAPAANVSCDNLAAGFGTWANGFISALTPVHRNVLLWGVAFSFGADPNGPTDLNSQANLMNRCFGQVYQTVDTMSRASAPPGQAGVLGLIGVNPVLQFVIPKGASAAGQFSRPPGGYKWDVATTQRAVKNMTDELTALYGHPKSPDVYMFAAYNPNAADFARSFDVLIHSTDGDPARAIIPASRIFPIEFATSSSGTRSDSWGDSQTPTTSVAGQDAWLRNTMCAFRSLGIEKSAYWAMYDPATLWMGSPWFNSGQQLSWGGYWGLVGEQSGSAKKPAWDTLAAYNQSPSSLECSASPAPNMNAWALSDYVTVGQTPKIVWTASEATSLRLDGNPVGSSWACDSSNTFSGAPAFDSILGGSCAYTLAPASKIPGDHSYVLSAFNGDKEVRTTLRVTVGNAPVITQVMDADYSGQPVSVGANEVLTISGKGFALAPTNYLRWSRPDRADVFLYHGDRSGHLFSQDAFQISTVIDSRIAPGMWTVYLYNSESSTPAVIGAVNVR